MAEGNVKKERHLRRYEEEEAIRKRPAPTFGSNDEYGAAQCVVEIIDNCVDEVREGFGDTVTVKFEPDGIVDISDCGRGLPMGWNDEVEDWDWRMALCTLYASGKYDNDQYLNSTGLNGLGLTATQYASDFMDVWSTYDYEDQGRKTLYMHFEKGKPIGDLQVLDPVREGTGTRIRFRPDPVVFPALRVRKLPKEYFLNILRQQAMLLDGMKMVFEHYELNEPIKLCYENGIVDFIQEYAPERMLKESPIFFHSATGTDDELDNPIPYKTDMKLAFNFSRDTQLLEVYHNGSLLFEQTENYMVNGLKTAFVAAFSEYGRSIGKLPKNEKFSFKDIEPLLIVIGATTAPGDRTWYKHQTKSAINNDFIINEFAKFVMMSVIGWLKNSKTVGEKVFNEVLLNKQAREAADKVSKKIISKMSKGIGFGNKPEKFYDCDISDPQISEVYFVEGDSALGSTLQGRDYRTQAIMACKGKPLNVLKNTLNRALSNDVIVDIFTVLGCGFEVEGELGEKLPKFDISKLRWKRIIICTDADVDGFHIRCLLLLVFYILAPSLIRYGRVYVAETPLYEMTWKNVTKFAFSEEERGKVLQEFYNLGAKPGSVQIQRSKGLGENTPEMMWDSTMNPETRRLTRIRYDEDKEGIAPVLNALLGDDIENRKMLIKEYFELTENAE